MVSATKLPASDQKPQPENKNGRTHTAAKVKSVMEHYVVLKAAICKAGVAINANVGDGEHAYRYPVAEVAKALANRAEDVSVALLGEPTSKSRDEYRWGRRGSLWLNRSGAARGRWYDHEHGVGGDLLDLIARGHRVQLGDAIMIAQREYLGTAVMGPAPASAATDDNAEARIKGALRIWREAVPLAGTPAERYFLVH